MLVIENEVIKRNVVMYCRIWKWVEGRGILSRHIAQLVGCGVTRSFWLRSANSFPSFIIFISFARYSMGNTGGKIRYPYIGTPCLHSSTLQCRSFWFNCGAARRSCLLFRSQTCRNVGREPCVNKFEISLTFPPHHIDWYFVFLACRVADLSNSQHRFKIDVNANQYNLTGVAVMGHKLSVIVVEGGPKGIRKYKHLLTGENTLIFFFWCCARHASRKVRVA